MKTRWLCILMICMLLPGCAAGGRVINLTAAPDAEWAFEEGAEILEVYFLPVIGADACILRMGNQVVMVDAATTGQRQRVADALRAAGIDHIDLGFNTHPHDDHIEGFWHLPADVPLSLLVTAFPQNTNYRMLKTVRLMKEKGVPTRFVWFKGENHELSRSGKPLHRKKRLEEITAWMDTYLKPEETADLERGEA